MIYEIKSYTDDQGRTIIVKIPQNNPKENLPTILEGIIIVRSPLGPVKVNFQFPDEISILGLEKCFEKFDELAKVKFEEVEKEIQKQMISSQKGIAVPTGINKGGIIIP